MTIYGLTNLRRVAFGLLTAIGLVSAVAAADLPSFDRIRIIETPRAIDDAELINQDGKPLRISALRGKVAFVQFGFTNCPDVCPIAMERLRALHESGAVANKDVAYVMVSVDGDRDDPPVMRTFLAKYSTDFIGLTAPPSRVRPIADQFSAPFYKGSHTGHGDDYNVTHSPQIFVLDPAGRLRAEIYGASVESMAGLTRALLAERR